MQGYNRTLMEQGELKAFRKKRVGYTKKSKPHSDSLIRDLQECLLYPSGNLVIFYETIPIPTLGNIF